MNIDNDNIDDNIDDNVDDNVNDNIEDTIETESTYASDDIALSIEEVGDKANGKNYLFGLKKYLSNHWSTVKEKLNEDVSLKIEYTGVGTKPFIEIGKKIKGRLTQNECVMLLGQDSECMPIVINNKTDVKSITLEGLNYDYNLDKFRYKSNKNRLNLVGSTSGHSIGNITSKNIFDTRAFVIFISLSSNDPLDEFYQCIEMIEKYEMINTYILVVFIHEKNIQHNPECMIEAINCDYDDIIETIEFNPEYEDNTDSIFRMVINKLTEPDKNIQLENILLNDTPTSLENEKLSY
ncbi:MAG: hypothetical protein JKX98_03735 [Alcanivoracaceae bacterium]|nr:hypothetical protein [Alcanivoracaceae bacterium]